jgi:hypothetical protein
VSTRGRDDQRPPGELLAAHDGEIDVVNRDIFDDGRLARVLRRYEQALETALAGCRRHGKCALHWPHAAVD